MDNYLKTNLNAFHDLLFVFREDGIFEEYLSPNHEDKLFQPKEDFLGKHHQEILPPHVSKKIEEALKKIGQGKERYEFDYSIDLNGKQHWYVAVFSKIEQGSESMYLCAVRDITERKNQELLLRGVLNTSPVGIMVFNNVRDSDGTIIDFEITQINKAVEELTGKTEEELVGQKLAMYLPEKTKKQVLERFKTAIETENPVEFYYQHENEFGETVWYISKVAKFKDGVVSSFLDITDQKKAEEEIVKKTEEMEELNRQKDKLFSVIAHDLRNLVSGTMATYDLVLQDYEAFSKDEIFEYLNLLDKKARSTTELLDDLLQWSRHQFQEVTSDPERLYLAELTLSIIKSVAPNAEEKGIGLINQVPDHIVVNADAYMVKTILRNLITNGIKFSHPGGEIVVSAERKGNEVEISVADEGVGIEKGVLEKILDKKSNYTTDGTKGEKGSGIGLDLCMDLVEKHGGKMWAESEPGKGSTFAFTLPGDTYQNVGR